MANNRMYLVYRQTGDAVFIGKRMGTEWYGVPIGLADSIGELFELAWESGMPISQRDNFVLAMEDSSSDSVHEISEFCDDGTGLTRKVKLKSQEGVRGGKP